MTIAIDGWGRGLAAGLEELAVAVDELQRKLGEDAATGESTTSFDLQARAALERVSSPPDDLDAEESEVPEEQELRQRAASVEERIASVHQETKLAPSGTVTTSTESHLDLCPLRVGAALDGVATFPTRFEAFVTIWSFGCRALG